MFDRRKKPKKLNSGKVKSKFLYERNGQRVDYVEMEVGPGKKKNVTVGSQILSPDKFR